MERLKNVEERGIRIARLLELIESTESILKLHQNQVNPSFLAVNQYSDLLNEHRAELEKLLKPYGFIMRLPKTKAGKVA